MVCIESLGGEARVMLPQKRAVPSVREVEPDHVEHEHWVVSSRTAPGNLRNARLELLLNCLVFILIISVGSNLENLASRYHEAVGGFFGASQERPDNTSFEGGNKSGATAQAC
jgi:hypothetical protein